ncbi:hypothetical protein [Streptacidiphilus sp. P02-A3a]|uniref:hypothetical protein n=1 Tax=Streptacidiphilus sp. P02-A3a TaxID=2704468 RepID=UPI0015FDED4E|nr:hypothetical protein [Streptacidiphilus sp. P02-A3a]QMU71436.1 hypothetical protein GXP74_27585 [Streptacidiphilus sp. P02-A3a]
MSSDIEADFAHELRAVAESAVQPAPASLYAGAVSRGRRIRRVAIVKRTLVGVATLGVIVAVGVPLLGGGASGGSPSVEAAAPSTATAAPTATAKPSATAEPATTAEPAPKDSAGTGSVKQPLKSSGGAAAADTAWMPDYVARTLRSLFPAKYSTAKQSALGVDFGVFAPQVEGLGGEWGAEVETDLATANGESTTSLLVERIPSKDDYCSSNAGAYDVCTVTSVDGGTMMVDKSWKDPETGTGNAIWTMVWNGPDGQSVTFGEATGAPTQALTVPQVEALLTAPAWNRVWQALPATCPYGAMGDPHATGPEDAGGQEGLVCATSRAAAIPIPTLPASGGSN